MAQVINLLKEAAPSKSIDENSSELINWYRIIDVASDGNKYTSAIYPTPGLTVAATINSPVRAMFEEHGVLYAVGGNTLYSIASNGTPTTLGTLNTSTGFAKIKGINEEIMIIDGTNGYIWNINTSTFTTITDTSFTNNATDLNAQDEFFMVSEPNSQVWQISNISDGTTWTVQSVPQFASVSGNENNLVCLTSLARQIWLWSDDTAEVWYNAGNTGFTFARNSSVYIEWGCAAKSSLAYGNNTLFLLAKSRTGGNCVVTIDNYTPVVISTPALNYQLSKYSTVSDAFGFCYQQEGHEFYVLTLPTAGVTWVYDITVQLWHQRTSLVNNVQQQWLPSCYAFCYNLPLVGDSTSGNIYKLDMTNNTENGVAITRTLQSAPLYSAGQLNFINRLQLDFDQTPGSGLSAVNLFMSYDGGNTFGSAQPATPVQNQWGQWLCYWTRLGASPAIVMRLQVSGNNRFILLGAWVMTPAAQGSASV